ncbi:MAG: glycosyltransferase family 4 protein, partial [candidate division Zixibacteria bacterium]|nr:glycosyltransferase family 4 protein [candidate division Zixibacteria bacterium]
GKPRLAFFASHRMFIKDIIAGMQDEYEIRLYNDGDSMPDLLSWADLAWFEWCDNFLIQACKLPKTCKIVCRLHSYEAFTEMPSKVDWSRVDHLLFVNESVRELFRHQVATPVETSVIHNGVDLTRFTIAADKARTKKIASVGYINYKKNPALLLYCFKKIHAYDPEYTLHVAGEHQDARIRLYWEHFLSRNNLPITYDGWVEDMPAWYADKEYVISTSLFESFHYSIAEGMAGGLIPLIHDWYGADNLYPRDYLYNDPDDCLELLKRLEHADVNELRTRNREHIARRFNQVEKVDAIISLLRTLIGNRSIATA